MAIAFRATGSWVGTTANQTVTIPATTVAGDLMVMFYGTKPYNDVPTIDQGWTDAGFATNGTIAAGVDVGSMQARIFWKIHTGTETNPTVTNGTNNVSSVVIVSFSKSALKSWDIEVGGGGDNTSGAAFSATTPALNLTANDFVASFIAINSDANFPSSLAVAATGITFSAVTLQPSAAFTTTLGGDMSARSGYASITAGTATTAITVTSTLALSAGTGSMYLIRMREVDPPVGTSFDPMGMMGIFGI